MKIIKYFTPFLLTAGFTTGAYGQVTIGQETRFDRELRHRDDQPVKEFIQSKENIEVKQKAQNLEISGDVRFEWTTITEKGVVLFTRESDVAVIEEGQQQVVDDDGVFLAENVVATEKSFPFHEQFRHLRGGHYVDAEGFPLSQNDFDVEFNLKIKYAFENAWAMAHLKFDNPAGIRGRRECSTVFPVFNRKGDEVEDELSRDTRFAIKGSGDGSLINLQRAYMGYNAFADGKQRIDIEIGRRKLEDVFTSELEFTSRFDGLLIKYANAIKDFSDWYWTGAVFVIDERVNHFGYIIEMGLINMFDKGLDIRYSFIDWTKFGRNRCFIHNPLGTDFQDSQISLSYTIITNFYRKKFPIEFYSGFLYNHAARKTTFTHRKRKNIGWYVGTYIGNVDKKGDWAIDIEYIVLQAQAVHEFDVGSIGRGDVLDDLLTDIVDERFLTQRSFGSGLPSLPSSGIKGYFPHRGNTNFVGWRFEFLYAFTDNLSLDIIYQFSDEEDARIGGPHRYDSFELEAIFAF